MDNIECPYCKESYELDYESDAFANEGEAEEEECPNCGKMFMVTASILWCFESEKADCLNDGKHNWEQMTGSPSEHFVGRFRCSNCYREEHRDEEGRKKALDKYFKKLNNKYELRRYISLIFSNYIFSRSNGWSFISNNTSLNNHGVLGRNFNRIYNLNRYFRTIIL